MKRVLIPALAVALSTNATFAWAWSDVTGTIERVSTKTHRVVLDNGQTFVLQKAVKMRGLKKGERVTISFEMQKGQNVGNKIKRAKG